MILSHLDPPKSLEELQNAVDEPRPGYEIHHIVEEQATSRNAQGNSRVFSEEQLQGRDNLVRIPYWKHRQISDWYSTTEQELRSADTERIATRKELGRTLRVGVGRAASVRGSEMSQKLSELGDTVLIQEFATLAEAAGKVRNDGEVAQANRALTQLWAIEDVLRARGPKTRSKLLPLLDDQNRLVRYYAAQHLLGIVPERSRGVLEENAKFWFDPVAADARGTLHMLDAGQYKPD